MVTETVWRQEHGGWRVGAVVIETSANEGLSSEMAGEFEKKGRHIKDSEKEERS